MMPGKKTSILLVEDDPSLRTTLSAILAASGYQVRSAEDGFSALVALRNGIPDIILSDLNMPGMSGFELLSVVRRRFPAVQAIAMSGAYAGGEVPPGVPAEAFYEKGTKLAALLGLLQAMSQAQRSLLPPYPRASVPIWIMKSGDDNSGGPFVVITCLECLRTFQQTMCEDVGSIHETTCIYCRSSIQYAIVRPHDAASPQIFKRPATTGMPPPLGRTDSSLVLTDSN
jgi:CheY-like chemotaxis protein